MSKILVTGGAGFIGSHLVDELLGRGHEVVVIDNLANGKLENIEEAQQNDRCTFIQGDILSTVDCKKAVQGVEVIYHLACLGVRHSLHSPVENHAVNATGTLNMLEAARHGGVTKFFYISTSEVYGKIKEFPIRESYVPFPITVYGSSKLAGEHYTKSYTECFGMNTTVLRIFNNFGPRAHYEGDAGEIIPRSIVKALYNEPPVIFGDGSITRDFFFVKDTARILADLYGKTGIEGETYNLGTGVEITMKELVTKLVAMIPEFTGEIQYLEDRPADVPRLWVNSEKLRAIYPYESQFSFEQGLDLTIAFYRELMQQKNLTDEINLINWK